MSHINIDPDCLHEAAAVATECGLHASAITGGLVQLWMASGQWSEALPLSAMLELFDGLAVLESLAAHGFIERVGDKWRPNPAKGHFVCDGGEARG